MRYMKILLYAMLICLLFPHTSLANSAEPPSLIVILRNAPQNTTISISLEERQEGHYKQFNGVNYFAFYRGFRSPLCVESAGESFVIDVPKDYISGYERTIALDYKTRTISNDKFITRTLVFIPFRIIATLIIEGFIFMLFGFREKKSWKVFLTTNILTQAALNITLICTVNPFWSYYFFYLAFYEMVIIIAEYIIFKVNVSEKRYILLYTILANLTSWYIGGRVLASLPI